MIEAQHVVKSYDQGKTRLEILKDIHFKVENSEIVAILGPSGSGKSTLLSLISLLEPPDSGKLLFDGVDTTSWSESQRTQYRGSNIGIVFQQFHLVPYLTALENVTLPLVINSKAEKNEILERAKELLSLVGLAERSSHRPSELSGGEQQRVALARALIHRPKLLLADEPSGNLDQETSSEVMDLFFKIVRETKTTTLLVTHDSNLADICDRKLFLSKGQLCS
ncbi:MAG TPA: hypothetical protein DCL41_07165 [Bdellovibrionales bacterium]|nr:hypothetical protein [Pseudobdellovibrionaceae bacterium]HAG91634.1 hypothetical protein [Bdellovibrionales bacterium]|tara:strand:+ start:3244 stop:3912 length:669 start_codon:yes stop_codon:yes gene_type:complete